MYNIVYTKSYICMEASFFTMGFCIYESKMSSTFTLTDRLKEYKTDSKLKHIEVSNLFIKLKEEKSLVIYFLS
jgi:hypothetical protein